MVTKRPCNSIGCNIGLQCRIAKNTAQGKEICLAPGATIGFIEKCPFDRTLTLADQSTADVSTLDNE